MRIYVDDMRQKPDGFDMSFTSGEAFLEWLKDHHEVDVDVLSLDHDMGLDHMDGYGLVKRLSEVPNHIHEVDVHSMNPVGSRNMRFYLADAAAHGMFPVLERIDGMDTGQRRSA